MMRFIKAALAGAVVMVSAASAQAHVTTIGWKDEGTSLSLYALTYHSIGESGASAFGGGTEGVKVNGVNAAFDVGSATALEGCSGPHGLASGTCSATWNSLNLDDAALVWPSAYSGAYRLLAKATIAAADFATYGLTAGTDNSVTLAGYGSTAVWAAHGGPYNAQISLAAVPLPAGFAMLGLGLAGLGGFRLRQKRAS